MATLFGLHAKLDKSSDSIGPIWDTLIEIKLNRLLVVYDIIVFVTMIVSTTTVVTRTR